MRRYEFKVVPAPRRGEKAKGAKTPEDRFAVAMANLMNQLGRDGWDYVRSDTMQVEDKSGWLSRAAVVEHTVLVFRRELGGDWSAPEAPASMSHDAAEPPVRESASERQHREAFEHRLHRELAEQRQLRGALAGEGDEQRMSARRQDLPEARGPRLGPARDGGA